MRTRLGWLLLCTLAAASCSSTDSTRASPPWQQLDVSVGARSFDGFDPVEDQTAFGLEYVAERPGDDFGVAFGISYSGETDSDGANGDVESQVFDASIGLRHTFDISNVARPYAGLGVTLIAAEAKVDAPGGGSESDDDIAQAFHLRVGSLFDITETFHIGFDARWVFGAGIDLDNLKGDGDSTQLALVAGFSF